MSSSRSVCSRQSQRSTLSSHSSSDRAKRRSKNKSLLFNNLLQLTMRQSHDDVSILSQHHLENDNDSNGEELLSDELKLNDWFRKLDELDRCVSGIEKQTLNNNDQQSSQQSFECRDSRSITSSSGVLGKDPFLTRTPFVEATREKKKNLLNRSSSAMKPLALASVQKENLMITNLFQVNQHQKQIGAMKEKQLHGGNRSISEKSHGSAKSVHSKKLQEVEIAKTVLLQELEQQRLQIERDQDALSVVSSYTVHDILDDLTECEDLDSQSVWSFRSSRSGRSVSRSRKKGGIGKQARGRKSGSTTGSVTSALQKQERPCGSRTGASSSRSVTSTSGMPMRIRNSLEIKPPETKIEETEQLYRAFLKNLSKQERLAHDTKVLSSASNIRAAIEAQNFSNRSKVNIRGQTVQNDKEGDRSFSQQWAVDIFENDHDWFSFSDFAMGQEPNAFRTHSCSETRDEGISLHQAAIDPSTFDISSTFTTASPYPMRNGDPDIVLKGCQKKDSYREATSSYSSNFKSTERSQIDSIANETKGVDSVSLKYDSRIRGAANPNPRYTFCDDTKVLKRMQKKSMPTSPSRINSSLGQKETLMKPGTASDNPLAPVAPSNNNNAKMEQGELQLSRNIKSTNEDSFARTSPRPHGLKSNQKDDFDFFHDDLFDCTETNSFKSTVPSSRGDSMKPNSKLARETKGLSQTNKSTENLNIQMNESGWEDYDSGWVGFVTSKKFESIPSGWETEEESDDDDCGDCSALDTSHFNNAGIPRMSHKSVWSETSPTTGIANLDSTTEMQWLKGSTAGRAKHISDGKNRRNMQAGSKTASGSKKLFSDDLFDKPSDDIVQWL